MVEQEKIEAEHEEIKKVYERKINDDQLRIEINNNEIIFIITGISNYKYIGEYKYEEIIKGLGLDYEDIKEGYEYLIKSEYKIKKEEKILIINNYYDLKLEEKILKNEEIIKILINEIKEMKDEKKKENEKINELIKKNEEKERKINILENKYNELKEIVYELDEKINYRDEINLIYVTEEEDVYNIFGKEFVKNNKDNIELEINGEKNNLINEYKLRKGENLIKMKIKNRIKYLGDMFYRCSTLKNVDELKYLNTKYCYNFEAMFYRCSSLSDIKALEKWNVSNGNNFEGMFSGCSSLSDIKGLEKWNVSNGNNFSCMFNKCSSLSDIKALEKWNVSNGKDFNGMFCECSSLSDIKSLEKWNISESLLARII